MIQAVRKLKTQYKNGGGDRTWLGSFQPVNTKYL